MIDRVRLADEHARSYASLRNKAARLVGWDDSEDVVQDAFVRALERGQSFRENALVSTWMHRIVINRSFDVLRQSRRRRRHYALEDVRDRGYIQSPLERRLVCAALDALDVDERRVCLLYDVVGMTHTEIARQLGIARGTSQSRLWTAHRRLRRLIAGDPDWRRAPRKRTAADT